MPKVWLVTVAYILRHQQIGATSILRTTEATPGCFSILTKVRARQGTTPYVNSSYSLNGSANNVLQLCTTAQQSLSGDGVENAGKRLGQGQKGT